MTEDDLTKAALAKLAAEQLLASSAPTEASRIWRERVRRQLAGELRYEELGRRPIGVWAKRTGEPAGRAPWGESTETVSGHAIEPEWAYHFRLVDVATGEVEWEGWDHPEAAGPHYEIPDR